MSALWFLAGAWSLIRATQGFIQLIGMQIQLAGAPPAFGSSWRFVPWLLGAGWVFTLIQWGFAALITASAVFLWMLRPWARTSLEIISWLLLVLVVGFGGFWLYMFLEMTAHVPPSMRSQLDWMGWIALGTITLTSIALGTSIGFLRGRTIREALQPVLRDAPLSDDARRYEVPAFPTS